MSTSTTTKDVPVNHREFVSECYLLLKKGEQAVNIYFIWDFIRKNRVTWIESMKLGKGMKPFDGELFIETLPDDYEYRQQSVNNKVSYCCQ